MIVSPSNVNLADSESKAKDYENVTRRPKSQTDVSNGTKVGPSNGIIVDAKKDDNYDDIDDILHHTKKLQKERREREPFFYCRWVANRPVLLFFICLGLQIALIVIPSASLVLSGFDLFPTNFDELPMELYSIPYRLRENAYKDRDKFDNVFIRTLTNTGIPTWERGIYSGLASVDIYFDAGSGNIFTAANLRKIQAIENNLVSVQDYSSQYCQTKNTSLECYPPISIIRFFDGTYAHLDAKFNDPTFSNIADVLYTAYTNNQTSELLEFFLTKTYTLTQTVAKSTMTRSVIRIGCSLSGGYSCERKKVREATGTFLTDNMKEKLEYYRENEDAFKIYYYSWVLWATDVVKQAMSDMTFAVGSMIFIFLFVTFHTRSLWVAGFAVISILTSFLCANLIYRCVIGFKYFGFFHILAIFIILGIGADDLFVFYDAWRLTSHETYPSLSHRLSDAYKKSILSMAFTSLTTMVAFLCSAISPLLATRSFGVFAALTVFITYLTVVIFFPTVIMVYHLKFEKFQWPCIKICLNRNSKNITEENPKSNKEGTGINNVSYTSNGDLDSSKDPSSKNIKRITENGRQKTLIFVTPKSSSMDLLKGQNLSNAENGDTKKKDNLPVDEDDHKYHSHSKMVLFFKNHYFRFVTHKKIRFVLIPIFVAVVAVFSYMASTLEPDNENIRVWKKSHQYSKAIDAKQYTFLKSSADDLVQIYVVWGLEPKDRSDCHFSAIDCTGKQVYDDTFDPDTEANQQSLINFCNKLNGLSAKEIKDLDIQTDRNGSPDIACFTRDLQTFLTARGSALGIDLTMPLTWTKIQNLMTHESTHLNASQFDSNFPYLLGIAMQYWMYNAYKKTYTADYGLYNDLFGEEKTSWSQQLKTDSSIYYGNKLKYISVRINTTLNFQTLGYNTGIPKIEKWEAFINGEVQAMPVGLKRGFQFSFLTWHWMYVQKELEENAIIGIVIGISVALPILIIATRNIVVGALATLSICFTTICVIGVIPMAGWKLGLLTSLNMTMLVGLAVDYVVHLAEGYKNSLHKDRLNRTRDMLEDMGTSVFSGACTTLGASLFMFFAEITFFLQFGVFLFCTIGFSLFYSLGLFTVLVGLMGPQNNFGSIMPLFEKIKSCLKRNKNKTSHANHLKM